MITYWHRSELPKVRRAKFRVIESFKGDPADLEYVYSHRDLFSCGLYLTIDEWVFFADERGVVSRCGGDFSTQYPMHWVEKLGRLRDLL